MPISVLLVLVVLLVVGGLATYLRLRKIDTGVAPGDPTRQTSGYMVTMMPALRGDIIRKIIISSGVVRYELEGELVGEITQVGETISTTFHLRGSPASGLIPVRIGTAGGLVQRGEFTGSFEEGDFSWSYKNLVDVIPLLKGEETMLVIEIPLDVTRSDFNYFRGVESALDDLVVVSRSGSWGDAHMPDLLAISISSVGVINAGVGE